jgi:1-acyl-sn-glycerol-3-phosphate acyltransferase
MNLSMHATLQNFAYFVLHWFYEIKVVGVENVPKNGRVIIAGNHAALMDGPFLLALGSRPLHVLSKFELFKGPIGVVLRAGGAVPIDWHAPDRTALSFSKEMLEKEEAVALFPEGTRSQGVFDWIRDGVVYLAANTNSNVVPVAILGARLTGQSRSKITSRKQPITIVIGHAINPKDFIPSTFEPTSRADLKIAGEKLRQLLSQHVQFAAASTGVPLPEDDVSIPGEGAR